MSERLAFGLQASSHTGADMLRRVCFKPAERFWDVSSARSLRSLVGQKQHRSLISVSYWSLFGVVVANPASAGLSCFLRLTEASFAHEILSPRSP